MPLKKDAAARVEGWATSDSVTAQLGTAMLAGEWVTSDDATALGGAASLLSQTVAALREAGYAVEVGSRGTGNARRYRVGSAGRKAPKNGRRKAVAHAEASAPPLGAVLTVRALILGTDGRTEVALTDGNGGTWTAHLTQ